MVPKPSFRTPIRNPGLPEKKLMMESLTYDELVALNHKIVERLK